LGAAVHGQQAILKRALAINREWVQMVPQGGADQRANSAAGCREPDRAPITSVFMRTFAE
jgi:hypothetical protein